MKPDLQLKAEVTAELVWDPRIDAAAIGVAVEDGIVTLSGRVDSLMQKHAVENAARRVSGVRGIALELEVKVPAFARHSDADIAAAALAALRWHSLVPEDKVKVEVEDGHVRLTGEVEWDYQKSSAEQCVRPLIGVFGVTNDIGVKPRSSAADVRQQITAALERHAQREAAHIAVEVEGTVVTLRGKVDSLSERDAAVGTAFAAKGVSRVVNLLEVTQ